MVGILITPRVNVSGIADLIKQVHNEYVAAPTSLLQEIQCLATLVDNCGTLGHFYFTLAVACDQRELDNIINVVPGHWSIVRATKGACLVVITTSLANWVSLPESEYKDRIVEKFEALGLGRFFNA